MDWAVTLIPWGSAWKRTISGANSVLRLATPRAVGSSRRISTPRYFSTTVTTKWPVRVVGGGTLLRLYDAGPGAPRYAPSGYSRWHLRFPRWHRAGASSMSVR